MKTGRLLSAVAALGLVASPIAAQAAQAERAPTPVRESEKLTGNGLWLVIAAVVAVGVGIIIIASDDDEPESP